MSGGGLFHRLTVLPVAISLRGEWSLFSEMRTVDRVARDAPALRSLKANRMTEALQHAVTRVPFYQRLGVDSGSLSDFPILEKEDLVREVEQLRPSRPHRALRKTTGGSTGRAVTVFKDPRGIAAERAATWTAFSWYGINPGERAVRLWGTGGTIQRKIRSRLADLAMNRQTFSAFAFKDEDLSSYWKVISEYQPRYIYGYASMIEALAEELLVNQTGQPGWGLKAIITTAEPLFPRQRDLMERAFGVQIRNEYGCGEVGPIAYECERGRLHLMETHLHIEVLDEKGTEVNPGETGEIVVTDLMNRAMPLIRYRVGDLATKPSDGGVCRCGLAFQTLQEVLGRTYDFVEDAMGRKYHGESIMYVLEKILDEGLNISAFQVVQEEPGHILFKYVAKSDPTDVRGALRDALSTQLHPMRVETRQVSEIERAPSGKHRLIIRNRKSNDS